MWLQHYSPTKYLQNIFMPFKDKKLKGNRNVIVFYVLRRRDKIKFEMKGKTSNPNVIQST